MQCCLGATWKNEMRQAMLTEWHHSAHLKLPHALGLNGGNSRVTSRKEMLLAGAIKALRISRHRSGIIEGANAVGAERNQAENAPAAQT